MKLLRKIRNICHYDPEGRFTSFVIARRPEGLPLLARNDGRKKLLTVLILLAGINCPNAFAAPVKILALGDSYTIGQGVEEKDRWPEQLKERLNARGQTVTVDIVARTGWTTANLLEVLKMFESSDNYDCVLVLIGANDQFQHRPLKDFEWDLNTLYQKAARFAADRPSRVIAVSIPDWGLSPRAAKYDRTTIAQDIDAFNQTAQDTAKSLGIGWVDITEASRRVSGSADFVKDGLHPIAAAYSEWVDIIQPAVEDVLTKEGKIIN